MVVTAPAIHYSTLATAPLEIARSQSHHSIKQVTSARFKIGRILKKLLANNEIQNERITRTDAREESSVSKANVNLSEKLKHMNDTVSSTVIKTANNNDKNIQHRTRVESELSRSSPSLVEPIERIPFTQPYYSILSNTERKPLELSSYHKHCTREEKHTNEKQQRLDSPLTKQMNISQSAREYHGESAQCKIKNPNEQCHQIKCNNPKSISTTTLPITTPIDNHVVRRHTSQKNNITTNSISVRPSNTQHLRRLQSKSKVRPTVNDNKIVQNKSHAASSISISIAQRIELLKRAMHHNQIEFYQPKLFNVSPTESMKSPSFSKIHQQTQTTDHQSKSYEFYHVHHHHIHSTAYLSPEWRTYSSIIGTLLIIFVLLLELIITLF